MTLLERLEADFKTALKAREEARVSALRLIRSALKVKEKEAGAAELTDAVVLAVLKTLAKQRQEAAEQFAQAGRTELAAKERAELALIQAYLPAQVDEAQIRAAVAGAIQELGAKLPQDLGRVMKASLARLGPGADGKLVNAVVRELLSKPSVL
jgi:uncharacterized protein YqeY